MPKNPSPALSRDTAHALQAQVRAAINEDLGAGDLSASTIPPDRVSTGYLRSRTACVLAGTPWFDAVFSQLDALFEAQTQIKWQFNDGDSIEPDSILCEVHGNSRVVLAGERTALNFLQTLSGTATTTAQFAQRTRAGVIRDTRKTIPGLRLAQKYAVQCGGGVNHRCGLYDAILIKENHLAAAKSMVHLVNDLREKHPAVPLELEVRSLKQIDEALHSAHVIDCVLLDNFDVGEIAEAVKRINGRLQTEASGNIDLDNVAAVSATGVDYIAVGELTKNLRVPDLSFTIAT